MNHKMIFIIQANFNFECSFLTFKNLTFWSILKTLRSNLLGTQFTLYDNGNNPNRGVLDEHLRSEMISIIYDTNLFGLKGPRKMTVITPGMTIDNRRVEIKPKSVLF